MTTRHARCLCGDCTATTFADPVLVTARACHDCQRESGAAFGYNAFFPEASVTTHGETDSHTHRFDSGRNQTAHRCKRCGSPMWFTMQVMPGTIGLRAGTFTDPGFHAPEGFWFNTRKHHWLTLPDDLPRHDRD